MGRRSNRVKVAVFAGLALTMGAMPVYGASGLEEDPAALDAMGAPVAPDGEEAVTRGVSEQGSFRVEYDRYGWLDRAVLIDVEGGSDVNWAAKREGADVPLTDAVSGSLDDTGGLVTFRSLGDWLLLASSGDQGASTLGITVLPNVSAEVAAPEGAVPEESVKVSLDGDHLDGCSVRWSIVDASGAIKPWDEVASGELGDDGGEISIGKRGAWYVMATVTDMGGRVYRFTTPQPIVVSTSSMAGTVSIDGEAMVGESVTAVLEDIPNGCKPEITWYIEDIEVGRGESYRIGSNDVGGTLTCVVRDASGVYSGSIESEGVEIQKADDEEEEEKVPLENHFSIFGHLMPGYELTLYDHGAPKDAQLVWTWYLDGENVQEGGTYLVKEEDVGRKIKAVVSDASGKYSGSVATEEYTIEEGEHGEDEELSGSVEIDGTCEVGNVVTARVTGIQKDADPVYTWYLDGRAVSTAQTYRILSHDGGHELRVTVTDGSGTYVGTLSSSAVKIPFAGIDDDDPQVPEPGVLTGTLSIDGEALPGRILSVSSDGVPSDAEMAYTWLVDGIEAGGGQTLVVTEDMVGSTVRVRGADTSGRYAGTLLSGGVIVDAGEEEPPDPERYLTGSISVSGKKTPGSRLTARVDDAPSDARIEITWHVDGARAGTGSSYLVRNADVGHRVVAVAHDAGGTYVGELRSTAVLIEEEQGGGEDPDPVEIRVSISGTPELGSTLTANVSGAPSGASLNYTWYVGGVASGSGRTYRVKEADAGKKVTVQVHDGAGLCADAVSSPVTIEDGQADPVEIKVSISGSPKVGSTLTANVSGAPGGASLVYTWYVGGSVAGNGRTYLVKEEDAGKKVMVEVSDRAGLCEDAASSILTIEESQVADGFVTEGGKTYYYEDGEKVFGEKKIDGVWYWFDSPSGAMAQSKWVYIAKASGSPNGKWCYYDDDGQMLYGQQYLPGQDGSSTRHWYYLDDVTGGAVTGWKHLDGDRYNPDGKWVYYDTGTYQMLYGEHLLPKNNDPSAETGWYWFDEDTGACVHGWFNMPDGRRVYYHSTDGYMIHGWTTIDGVRTRFDDITGELLIQCDEKVIMCQAYGPWAEQGCGPTSNIRISGCGAGAVAHAASLINTDPDRSTPLNSGLSHWASDDVTPGDVVNAMSRRYPNNGYYLVGDGIRENAMRGICESDFGLRTGGIDRNRGDSSVTDIRNALEAGRCVIISSIGPNGDIFSAGEVGEFWSTGGHYICFYQYKDGVFWAKDSGTPSGKGNACKYDWNMMRRFLAASPSGSCFWVGRK